MSAFPSDNMCFDEWCFMKFDPAKKNQLQLQQPQAPLSPMSNPMSPAQPIQEEEWLNSLITEPYANQEEGAIFGSYQSDADAVPSLASGTSSMSSSCRSSTTDLNGMNYDNLFPELSGSETVIKKEPEEQSLGEEEDESSSPVDKSKRKRAPRKRLTQHQKQAHNKIEKRYRININAKIAGIQKIIPWVSNEKTAFEIGDVANDKDIKGDPSPTQPRLNKSMILDKAYSYIIYLQDHDKHLREENEMLRREIQRLNAKWVEHND